MSDGAVVDRGRLSDPPSVCLDNLLERYTWGELIPLRVDGRLVGVRATSDEVTQGLLQAFGNHLAPGEDVDPNYSVVVGEGPPETTFHFLYRSGAKVARSRDLRRVLDALVHYVSWEAVHPADGHFRFDATPLVVDGRVAVITRPEIRFYVAQMSRRLADRGVELVDVPGAIVQLDPPALVVPPPFVDLDEAALDRCAGPGRGLDPAVPAGVYPLGGWVFAGEAAGLMAPSVAIMEIVRILVFGAPRRAQEQLDAVADLVRGGVTESIEWARAPAMAGTLAAAARRCAGATA